ncbi:MAG: hypothetical protein CMJ25_14670 [Phycisphaerae bacterium]|nr:hypothetical protein [Phycisphaerae bacterium]|tara:strand:- start:651 stop:908 length:258 start_codon:yes stop_codon:yes gene_type:complete
MIGKIQTKERAMKTYSLIITVPDWTKVTRTKMVVDSYCYFDVEAENPVEALRTTIEDLKKERGIVIDPEDEDTDIQINEKEEADA